MMDPFDPNTWDWRDPVFRMYAGRQAAYACFVDEDDYKHFTQWLWEPHINKGKIYFRRSLTERPNGVRKNTSLYLHVEIMKRSGFLPLTEAHEIVDHLDGDTLNNRRVNLRWATRQQNNRNRFGVAARQRELIQ